MYGNLEFLNGNRGAHINISGVSGVATKTSYAMFLLHALFGSGALGAEAANTRALIFNVKGEDLLYLDKPNAQVTDDARRDYAALGLPAEAFRSVSLFAPASRGKQPLPDTGSRMEGVTGFYWTIREFCEERYLRFLFADADDYQSQIGLVVQQVETELASAARLSKSSRTATIELDGEVIASFDDLVEAIARQTNPDQARPWGGRAAPGTVSAFLRRLDAAKPHLSPLIRGHASIDHAAHAIDTSRAQLTVVDIHNLHDRAQRFVVGVVLRRELARKEGTGTSSPLMFVVLDELNKLRPSRRLQSDQGSPARHRRARAFPRRGADWGPTDRKRSRAADRGQLLYPGGRAPGCGGGKAWRIRLPHAERLALAQRCLSPAR